MNRDVNEREEEDDDEYIMPAQRKNLAKLSKVDALFEQFNSYVLIEILLLPCAFNVCGWLHGIIFIVFISLCSFWSTHLMLNAIYKTTKKLNSPFMRYIKCLQLALKEGPTFLRFLSFPVMVTIKCFFIVYYFALSSHYVSFIVIHLTHFWSDSNIYVFYTTLSIALIFLVFLRNVKYFKIFSISTAIVFCLGIFGIMLSLFPSLPQLNERESFTDIRYSFLLISDVLVVLSNPLRTVDIQANMLVPRKYLKIFGIYHVMTIDITVTMILMGFFGYWQYGYELKYYITEYGSSRLLIFLTMLSAFLAYPIFALTGVTIFWNKEVFQSMEQTKRKKLNYAIKTIYVLLTVLVVAFVPSFGESGTMKLSIYLPIACYTFPALLNICIDYEIGYGECYIHLLRDFIFLLFGLALCSYGMWTFYMCQTDALIWTPDNCSVPILNKIAKISIP